MELASQVISEVRDDHTLADSVAVVRYSFRTVAAEFGLTRENCPTHPSFVTFEQLNDLRLKGVRLFGLYADSRQVGFVAIEKASDDLYYMEKLAVPPEHRRYGYGTQLVRFVLDYVGNNGGNKLSIGIIDEHKVLKDWYRKLGFQEISTKKFTHLPFTVCFMEIERSPL